VRAIPVAAMDLTIWNLTISGQRRRLRVWDVTDYKAAEGYTAYITALDKSLASTYLERDGILRPSILWLAPRKGFVITGRRAVHSLNTTTFLCILTLLWRMNLACLPPSYDSSMQISALRREVGVHSCGEGGDVVLSLSQQWPLAHVCLHVQLRHRFVLMINNV